MSYLNFYEKKEFEQKFGKKHKEGYTSMAFRNWPDEKLPEEIIAFKNIKKLEISESQIKTLPDCIGDFEKLEEIVLWGCPVETFPDSLANAGNLTKLSLYECKKMAALPEVVGNIPQLKFLALNRSKVKTLPDSIGNLKNLETFNSYKNALEKLPETFGKLQKLENIWLYDTKVKDIEAVGQLKALKHFAMYKGGVKEIPASFANLQNLERLRLEHLKISELPSFIYNWEKLHTLSIVKCPISNESITEAIANWKNLSHFELSDTNVSQLPEPVCQLKHIKYFIVQNSPVSRIPEGLGIASRPYEIHLNGCQIEKLPESFSKIGPTLMELDLTNNPLKDFPLMEDCFIYNLKLPFKQLKDLPFNLLKLPLYKEFINEKGEKRSTYDPPKIEFQNGKKNGIKPTHLAALIKVFRDSDLSDEMVKKHFAVYANDNEKVSDISQQELFGMCSSKNKILKENAFDYLKARTKGSIKQFPLKKGNEVLILGKTKSKAKDLKAKLEKHGLQLASAYDPKVQHVVLGSNLKKDLGLGNADVVFLDEPQLIQIISNPYLMKKEGGAAANTGQNLAALLNHKDPENIALALELMQEGGVPEELITRVFLIYKMSEEGYELMQDKKMREKARKLLQLYASEEVRKRIRKWLYFAYDSSDDWFSDSSYGRPVSYEEKICTNIEYYAEGTEIDGIEVAEFLYRQLEGSGFGGQKKPYRRGYGYLLKHGGEAQQLKTLKHRLTDPHPYRLRHRIEDKNSSLTKDVAFLDLSKLRFSEVPKMVWQMPEIELLDLRYNSLKSLPEEIKQLKKLKRVYLSHNRFGKKAQAATLKMLEAMDVVADFDSEEDNY